MKVAYRNLVPIVARMHAANQTDIVDDPRRMRQQLGQFGAAVPARRKGKRTP